MPWQGIKAKSSSLGVPNHHVVVIRLASAQNGTLKLNGRDISFFPGNTGMEVRRFGSTRGSVSRY